MFLQILSAETVFARYNLMMIDPVLIRPARPSDAKTIARIHVDGWRTAYAGFIPASFLDGMNYEED